MATLFNTRIADTYQGLLKTIDNGILGAALTQLSDGSGNGTGVFLNTSGDLEATGIVSFGSLKDTAENITITKFVDAADGLVNNDNDTTMPTSAAIIDYVAAQVTLADLDFLGDSNVGLPSVDLDSQKFSILGTANRILTSASGQTLTINLPDNVGPLTSLVATTLVGDLNGTINTLTTAVTQPLGNNTVAVATTAFVDRIVTAQDLDFQGTTGIGSVDLDSQVLIIKGTTNEITTVGGAQTLTIGLPSSITTNLVGNVTGNADTATAWQTGRTISLSGQATGVTSLINGTQSVSAVITLTNSAVIGKVLTGLQSPAGATILATDSMLLAFGKLQSQINGIAEGLQFQGSWNASTNTPTLTSGVGTQGHYYIVSVAGSTDLDGITDWEVGDWAIYSTTSVWQRLDQTGVQGTGTTGNLTKWATGSTISDSIVSESGTALTVTGSLTTTLDATIDANLKVGINSLIVNSVSDAVSMAGILTVASPVINTGISGSAVLDDDTFATANATTVATTESIKAYIDSNTGSGTAGKIPKFAAGGESLDDSIIDQSSGNVTINTSGTGTSKLQVVGGIRNWNSALTLSSRLEADGLYFSGAQDVFIVSQQALNFYAGNAQKLSIASGGDATFSKSIKFTDGAAFAGAASIRRQSDALIFTGGSSGFFFNDDTNAVSNFVIGATGGATFNSSEDNTVTINTTNAVNNYISLKKSGTDFGYLGTGSGILSAAQGFVTGDFIFRSEGAIKLCNGNNAALTIASTGLATFTPNGGNNTGAVNALHLKNTGTAAGDGTAILFTAGTSADGAAIKSTGRIFNGSDLTFFTGGSAAANARLTISEGGVIGQGVTPLADPYIAGSEQWLTYQIGKGGVMGAYKSNNESMFGFNTYLKATDGANKAIISGIDGSAMRYYADRMTFNFLTSSGTSQTQTEVMRISSGGDVKINTGKLFVSNGNIIGGSATDITGTHYFNKGASVSGGILYAGSSTTGRFSLVVQASDSAYNNSPDTCLKIGATSSTSRSISAAGTVNASGADYAEYMIKSTTDPINKGDIVGVNSDGLLTNIFNDAISFVIKSTDPSFVGGDIWGIESEDKNDIEQARIKVDRIAFSGQVPCNVTSSNVGDYIIAKRKSDGKIIGEAVSSPTFEQYKMSVGKVWKIMEDGRSWIAVKIG